MESINTNIYRFDNNDYTINVLEFQIWADTNFWDSNVLNENRNLYFDLIITSTDLYNDKELKCYWFYEDSDLSNIELQSKFNNSEFLYDINQCTFNNKQTYLNISNNNLIYSQNTYNQNYGVTWNSTKNVYMYLYYNDTDYDLWLDNASLNLTNSTSTPFYSSISNTNYVNGYNEGYQAGLSDNQQDIYSQGFASGYSNGELNGYNNGFNEGNQLGISEGYENGYNEGYSSGYYYGDLSGYQRGLNVGENGDLSNMVVTIADTPLNVFKTIFDVEFLGINLVPLFFGLATLGVVIWVVRRFMGGD